jgi:uncharacterized protein
MQNDRFEWDDDKARTNLVKYKISFEAGCLVFDDPQMIDEPDDDPDEERYRATGLVMGNLISVLYTEREKRYRIISVRKASPNERKDYVSQNG